MRVLVVDDEAIFRDATAKALEQAGSEVSTAADYQTALEILNDEKPLALLVTDVVMPNQVHGFALARMARLRRRDLKLVYVTGYDVPTHEAMGKVLRKPITADALVNEVRLALAS